VIHRTTHWLVEHCIGPLGVGTLVVKPERHVVHLGDLRPEEAAEMGPLLAQTAAVVARLCAPGQVYVCLWSHARGVPGHIHFVVQPVKAPRRAIPGTFGPALQVAMLARNRRPSRPRVEEFAGRARREFGARWMGNGTG
jgi:diadenosine tetraphosphate (Ap4A) HIT family hydrolase